MKSVSQNTAQENLAPGQSLPRGIPDLAYIRRQLNIETVGQLLGLDITRHFARCFRTENHANGDSDPSLHFLPRSNRAICFGCGDRDFSNIDLVMGVLRCDLPRAIAWFSEHFGHLPTLRGRPAGIARTKPFHVGMGGALESLVRSGVYARMSYPARTLLTVIRELRDENGETQISYPELMRKAGIGSRSTIKAAIDELTAIHILSIRKGRVGILQPKNIYSVTPEHPRLIRLMAETASKDRDTIAQECEYRRELKLSRRRKLNERVS